MLLLYSILEKLWTNSREKCGATYIASISSHACENEIRLILRNICKVNLLSDTDWDIQEHFGVVLDTIQTGVILIDL